MNRIQVLVGLLALAMVGLLVGCDTVATGAAPTEVPVVVQGTADTVVAEAVIEPARWDGLSFEIPGDVTVVLVEEGETVAAGDLVMQLETDDLERALARAEIGLQQAQLRLDRIQEPADEADVETARAAISDATAAYEEARANLALTESGVSVGEAVRAARFARDEAYRVYQDTRGQFDDDHWRVQWAYDAYLDALGRYNRAVEGAELQLVTARNQVTRANHALERAQNSLDKLLEGADELDVEAARLDVEAARLALEEAGSGLEEAVLTAPFDGVVAEVSVEAGDAVAPGQVVVVVATLDQLRARTVDLTELDVARVTEGQPATVSVDALPDQEFAGVVHEIALQPGDYRGDVVYAVTVELTDSDLPVELRWGMTALVEIEAQ